MSKQAKQWPRIVERRYPSGRISYVVDLGVQNGKRDRQAFPTKAGAEGVAQQKRIERANEGTLASTVPVEVRLEATKCVAKLAPHGASLTEATDHYLGCVLQHRSAPTLSIMADQLLEEKRAAGRPDTTVDTVEDFLRRVTERYGDRQLQTLTLEELNIICLDPKLKPRTRYNRIRLAKHLYKYAITKGWAGENLAMRIIVPTWDPAEPGVLTVDQIRHLLDCAHEFDLLAYVALALFAGVRCCELMRLDWTAVKRQDREIVIGARVAKGRSRRVISYDDTLASWLELCARASGPVINSVGFRERFNAWRKAAGIDLWPHNALRHSFASYHLVAFKDPVRTAYLMGHKGGTDMLDNHYKALVSGVDAEEFWALRPAGASAKTVTAGA